MAAIFLAIDLAIPIYVSLETIILAFAVCVLVVCSAVIDTPKQGLMCGSVVLVAQNIGAFVIVAIRNGAAIATAMVPYSLILTSSYVAVGLLGGYVGGRLARGHGKMTKPIVSRR